MDLCDSHLEASSGIELQNYSRGLPIAMVRYRFLAFVVIAVGTSSACVFAQTDVELPQEVIAGWRRLAEQSKTYRILFSDHRYIKNSRGSIPILMTRLNDQYVKYENLKESTPTELKEGESRDFSPHIESVFLYDGSEYFSLLRSRSASKYTLAGVGSNGFLEQTLRPNVPIGPSVVGFSLLELINSPTNKIQAFEKSETSCQLTYLDNRPKVQSSIVHLQLDPSHDYRIISATFELPMFQTRSDFFYDDHPAIPSKVTSQSAKPNSPVSGARILKLLPDQTITPAQFQLEYYGLPPFRKRSPFSWLMIAVTTVGAVVLICAIYCWKRKRASALER